MLIIAHRSGPVEYPEQTVESALLALKDGADMVEIDLRFSADGRIIVCHDDNAERVFGVDKKTDELTADEFVSLCHKENSSYHGHLFEDYINAGVKPLLLHIKEGGEKINTILDFISAKNYLGNIVMGVANPEDVARVKKYDKNIPVLAFMKNAQMLDACIAEGADFIRLWQGWTRAEYVERIHSADRGVWIMAGNADGYETGYTSMEFLDFIREIGVDGVLVNNVRNLR